MQEGPYFDELAVGQEFGGAPGITLTSGLAAAHQAITGDRLALATDHDLCRRVTGGGPLASPSLVWDVAIGQSTVVTQHVKANLFYRGLAFHRAPRLGDTLRTSTQVVALKQNQPREGRAPTGLAVLRITTVDQQRRPVLDFWRCAMLPLRDEDRQTGHADDLASVGQAIDDPAALVSGWRLAEFAGQAAGPRLAEPRAGLRAGQSWAVPGGDVVSGAPELARLTLNIAMAHHDAQAAGGQRLVYGGHTVGLALAQAARSLPSLVTVAAWHGCDHLGPVHEGDTLRSTISVEQVDPLPAGGAVVHLRSRVRAEAPGRDGGALSPSGLGWPGGEAGTGAAGGRDRHEGSAPRDVLDWRYIAVVALGEGQSLCGPHHAAADLVLPPDAVARLDTIGG
jgi:acyl dehydratase